MANSSDRSEAAVRRAGLLDRVAQVGRGRRASEAADQEDEHEARMRRLEERIDQLEALVQGLQDAVHRESSRQDDRIGSLEHKSEPGEMSRALSRDARERGL